MDLGTKMEALPIGIPNKSINVFLNDVWHQKNAPQRLRFEIPYRRKLEKAIQRANKSLDQCGYQRTSIRSCPRSCFFSLETAET
jgi:hypothetical protein